MQVVRLVKTGHVDKVIAFDELPKRLLEGVEMRDVAGLPRHWKEFVGVQEKKTPSYREKDPVTGVVKTYGGEVIKAPMFFVLYYTEVNNDITKWGEISAFVRRAVSLKFRLLDKLEDMALPMAVDPHAELSLEPEHLEERGAIIPIPIELQEKTPAVLDKNGKEVRTELPPEPEKIFKCEKCDKPFTTQQAVKMHAYRKHPEAKEEKKEPVSV